MRTALALVLASAAVLLAGAGVASAFDPAVEASNFSKGNERQAIYDTPEYQALLRQVSVQNQAAALKIQAADPEREFLDLCGSGMDGCAGDVRLYDWVPAGYGISRQVLWTARDGATISGRVWATQAGPAKRPGIVITNGSVQADEQLYWFVAQTLAKAGYVVLTWDPQGQGQSDTYGEGADRNEGFPAQSDGRPFYDGTEDALNFFFSTPEHPYEPVPSCSTGTSHADKQNRRVAAALNPTDYNPYAPLLDPSRVGIAGHSYGAAGVSYIGQWDPRVKAIVAFDNLGQPAASGGGSLGEQPCPANPAARTTAPITKPALGLSADYFIPPTPNTSDPDPLAKSTESRAYSAAHVDTGEIVIRGGTHYDFDWIPNAGFPATLRGADEITWYTRAWFDRYVKGDDPTANARLRTARWRADADEGAVDPGHDANTFSFYYRSRLDIGLDGGGRFVCEDLRTGCPGLTGDDGVPGHYDYLSIATSKDAPGAGSALAQPGQAIAGAGAGAGSRHTCTSRRRIAIHPRVRRGTRILRVDVSVTGRRHRVVRGTRAIVVDLLGRRRSAVHVRLVVHGVRHGRRVRAVERHTFRTCRVRHRTKRR